MTRFQRASYRLLMVLGIGSMIVFYAWWVQPDHWPHNFQRLVAHRRHRALPAAHRGDQPPGLHGCLHLGGRAEGPAQTAGAHPGAGAAGRLHHDLRARQRGRSIS